MASEDSLTESERLVLRLHPHWKTMLRPIMILIVVVAAALVLLILLSAHRDVAYPRLAIGVVLLTSSNVDAVSLSSASERLCCWKGQPSLATSFRAVA